MSKLPTGTVTFLFTDIEGSTQLWEKHPEEMKVALAKHDSILKESIQSNQGHIIKTTGDGVHAVFAKAIDAINATIQAQKDLQLNTSEIQIKVRMGLHTGEAEMREDDYYGQTLNRTARIMSVGAGGQILISSITADVVREHLPTHNSLKDLGEHRLKDLIRPERLYQLNEKDLTKDFPLLKSLNTLPNNLPLQLTSFIGREKEMDEASKSLSSTRLLTFIGPGGTGKTRLSLQVAAEQFSNFKDGVWLVELAPITDSNFITAAMASIFELREMQNIPLINILLDYLRAKQILLILDNCEHIVEASAQIAGQILHTCPQLKIIASSREALGIDGEAVYRVPSLLENEATRLFVERATKADSRFNLTEHNASSIAQICSRLDGIPLAIELAAARTKLFTAEQIAERLDDRFKLLTGGSRTALPRQQTLRALIDWSYQSLNEIEQRALRRLAVFSGGWTIEGAESVIGADEALDSLMGLVNKSLVHVDKQEGASRYRFLETIRQYAMEKLLESGEAVDARNRHLDFMLAVTEYSPSRMFGTEDVELLNRIESEYDNLRAALEWATLNHPDKAFKLTYGLAGFWVVRDFSSEAFVWCNITLEKTEKIAGFEQDRARLYSVLGWLSVTLGEHKKGRVVSEQAIALATKSNDFVTATRAYTILALICIFLGDFPNAFVAAEKAESIARTHNLESELSFALTTRAQLAYLGSSDLQSARPYILEGAELAHKAGFHWASSFLDIGMGHMSAIAGDIETARALFMRSAETARKLGNKRVAYSSQSEFAHVLRQLGELEEPLATYRDLLPKWMDLGHRSAVAHELECIAFILRRKEEPELATTLLGAAEAIRKSIDSDMTSPEKVEYEKEISALKEMVGENEFNKHWLEGQKLSMNEAIEMAVGK